MKNQTRIYLQISEVFPGLRSDLSTLKAILKDLSLTDSLFWCARLNLVISNSSEDSNIDRQTFGLKQFFSPDEIRIINSYVSKNGGTEHVIMFFRGQILELMRWILLCCQNHELDGTTFENPDNRRKFAQALLIASDVFSKRIYEKNFSLKGGLDTSRKRALGPIRKAIEATAVATDLWRSLGRGWFLWGTYFERHYPSLEGDFSSVAGLTMENYFRCLCSMTANYLDPKRTTGLFNANSFADGTKYKEVFQKYISLESQDSTHLRRALWGTTNDQALIDDHNLPAFDYKPFRQKPILRADDGRAVIMDPIFYGEKFSVGPLFLLTGKYPGKQNELFGAFGRAFEEYACDILRRMYPRSDNSLTEHLSCNTIIKRDEKLELEIDAHLNDARAIVLFEMKAVWILEKDILADNHEAYLQHLRERYCGSAELKGDRKYKGVTQLSRIISTLATSVSANHEQDFRSANFVYPVLVVHDPLLDAPVYGNFLAEEFKASLSPDSEMEQGIMKKGGLSIAPLIIMTIDELENLEVSIKQFSLRDLLADYSYTCPDRLISLHNFIAYSKYGKQMYHNPSIIDKAMELLLDTQQKCF